MPSPVAVLMFFETATNEHIPRKYDKRMLPGKIETNRRLKRWSMVLTCAC
jgi:hypothetical protein